MVFLSLLPVVLSFMLLAAHFLRSGNLVLVGLCLITPLLLFVRKPWVVRLIQVLLVLGALEWLWTTAQIIERRQAAGGPWIRAAVIFGGVILWTLGSTLVFFTPRLSRRYFGE
jgi:hypothetical protein